MPRRDSGGFFGAIPKVFKRTILIDCRIHPGVSIPSVDRPLKLRDFTGIARSMDTRLNGVGIYMVENLCAAPKPVMHSAWDGVHESQDNAPMRISFTHIPDVAVEED